MAVSSYSGSTQIGSMRGLSEYYLARPEHCPPDTVVAGYSALKEDDIPAVAAALARAWVR